MTPFFHNQVRGMHLIAYQTDSQFPYCIKLVVTSSAAFHMLDELFTRHLKQTYKDRYSRFADEEDLELSVSFRYADEYERLCEALEGFLDKIDTFLEN